MFANTVGSPLISSSFWQHHFSKALRAAGVSCRFHDLRHTSVALAIAEGAHPKAIQTRMGHSSITVTLDRYGHLFPELDEAIAVSFGERLREARLQHDTVVVHAGALPSRGRGRRASRGPPEDTREWPTASSNIGPRRYRRDGHDSDLSTNGTYAGNPVK